MKEKEWTFLTNHGRVIAYLSKNPRATTREIAQTVGVTERTIQKVIYDLEKEGYIARYRVGRGNRYIIHPDLPLRHPMEREYAVRNVLAALGCYKKSQRSKNNSSI